jgi:trigger factor
MQVTVESTGTLGRRMTVAVPAARLEKEFVSRIQRVSRTARFPGFRPGKAPMKMVEAQYGGQVMDEIVGDLIRSTFYEAVNEQGLKPAGGPNIEPKPVDRGHDFEYTATFEIYPDITRIEIQGSTIQRPVVNVTEEDVNRTIDTLRHQRVEWNAVERAAQNGDRVIIDFEGSIEGTVFEGGKASNFPLVLGNQTLIEGFESGLIGLRAGESRTLDLSFPADYRNAQLAGKAVRFAVTVNQVTEPVLPEVNEAFARALGIEDGNVASFRSEVRANLERELADRVRRELRDQVFKALLEANTFDVPQTLEQAEIQNLIQMTRSNMAAQGIPANQVPTDPVLYAEQARSRVKLGLILAELAKVRGLKADPAKVRTRLAEQAASYDNPKEYVDWHYAKPERLSQIEAQLIEDQAVDVLLETAKVEDKPMSFQELTQPTPRKPQA